jgi:CheY-like chemotaxis protein
MLEDHELLVDTAESAEAALEYLSDHRPDVIFMDHQMPGMDGFEAVSAIKNNPDTATIPIMMYTSQRGEVYVGQARALGAVGVLPKQVEPVEVSKVLESLRVIGKHEDSIRDNHESAGPAAIGTVLNLETPDQDLRALINDLFAQQQSVLRDDLMAGYEHFAARVVDEIRPLSEEPDEPPPIPEVARPPLFWMAAVSVLIMIGGILAWLYRSEVVGYEILQTQYTTLQQSVQSQRMNETRDDLQIEQQFNNYQQTIDSMYAAMLDALEWGANEASGYEFNELPLGDSRLAVIEDLSERLQAIGFAGLIRIETHVANFCLNLSETAGYRLANPNQSAADCDRIGLSAGESYELGLRQSIAFANYIRLSGERSGGRIRYEIVSRGNGDPVIDYPASAASLSAGDWNSIASGNNRVEVSLLANDVLNRSP